MPDPESDFPEPARVGGISPKHCDQSSPSESSTVSSGDSTTQGTMWEDAISQDSGTDQCSSEDIQDERDSSKGDATSTEEDNQDAASPKQEPAKSQEGVVATAEELRELMALHPMPEAPGATWMHQIRFIVFTTYRRLYALVIIANLTLMCIMAARAYRNHESFAYADAITAVAANIFSAVLVRNERFMNGMWRLCIALTKRCPLCIRRHTAKVYSYGGLHSSCAVSALAWYIFFAILVLQNSVLGSGKIFQGVAITTALMLLLFIVLIGMSIPPVRRVFHNQWEVTHRFAGWISVATIWAQTILVACSAAEDSDKNIGIILATTPAFWFLIAITALVIYPWLSLRKMKFTAERLSTHATRLHFEPTKKLPSCVGLKLSDNPLIENHAFAAIPEPDGRGGWSIIIANNGDWTKKLIAEPPAWLWTRARPAIGVIRLAMLFPRIVIVATGSGIGPCLSFLNVHPERDLRIIWSARSPCTNWGTGVLESVLKADPNAIVIDTLQMGKNRGSDLTALTYALYNQSGAEAVVIISNPRTTKEVVYSLEQRRIPAYGAIWDS